MAFARKQKKIKQANLGKMIRTSGDIIGKYERGENIPSMEVAVKIAEDEQIDNDTLKCPKEVQGLDQENRSHVFATIDAFIKVAKLKSIVAL